MPTDRPETLDDVKAWIAEHDGRINAYWKQQFHWNEKVEGKMSTLSARIGALERKVMWIAGMSSAAGAVAGSLIPLIIKALGQQ